VCFVSQESGWIMGDNGTLLKTSTGGVVSIGEALQKNANEYLTVYQNFPNPCSQSTTIQYKISDRQSVKLKVYDAKGKQIANLIDENQSGGSYSVNLDTSGLSAGVYFYQLHANGRIETKRMIICR
jgi:hypothetical protein